MTGKEFSFFRKRNGISQSILGKHAGFQGHQKIMRIEMLDDVPEVFLQALGRIMDIDLLDPAFQLRVTNLFNAQPVVKKEEKPGKFQKERSSKYQR